MVEFALITPILVSLFFGVVSFGYSFYTYNRLEDTVRGAARFATITNQTWDANGGNDPPLESVCTAGATSCTVVIDLAQSQLARRAANFVVYGTPVPADTDQPTIEGLTTANVVFAVEVTNHRPQKIWVMINGYSLPTPFGSITLTNKPAAVFPWFGRYAIPG